MKIQSQVVIVLSLITIMTFFINCAGSVSNKPSQNNKYSKLDNVQLIDKYRMEVAYKVHDNWTPPETDQCDGDLKTSLVFTILKNGEIQNLYFKERSNCKEYDYSAYSAIIRTAPFNPFPNEIKKDTVEIGLKFQPFSEE